MNMRTIGIVIAAIVVLGGGYVGWRFMKLQQAAVKWDGPVEGIASENIVKGPDAFDVELTTIINAPADAVYESFLHPERSEGMVKEIRQAKVLSGDDKKKTVLFQILALDQVQTLTVDLNYDAAQKLIGIKTVEGSASIDGSYKLTPSPGDGKKTLVTYKAKQSIPLPLPEGVLKGAIKEQFVNLMNAIRKDLTQQGKMTASVRFALRAAA
jgi:uncharacterized membrane protein